jgi:ABC-2 type transport system ATP-binding protein
LSVEADGKFCLSASGDKRLSSKTKGTKLNEQIGAGQPGDILVISGLTKAFRKVEAVRDLSLNVRRGEILGLVGPNGAGKTTTMRILAGIIPPSDGRILIAGHDLLSDPLAAKRALAFVPDDPALFGALTVYEHLVLAARAYSVQNWESRAEQLLDDFQLAAQRNTLAQELSRGARQKTAICAAYLHGPPVILLDEPLTGLDPHSIRHMKRSIRERAEAGAAFIISSHLLSLIDDLCTDLLVLHRGQALFRGSVAEARRVAATSDQPASLEDSFFEILRDAVNG